MPLRLLLPLRALFGRPLRRLAAFATRRAEFWVPSDETKGWEWHLEALPGDLPCASTASTMRTLLRRGDRFHWQMVPTGQQAHAICSRGGYLSRALLGWCLDQAVNPQTVVEALGTNPAVTPAHMAAVREILEAKLWWSTIRERGVTALWSKQLATTIRPDSHYAVLAWLAASHPKERPRDWSPFMQRAVAGQGRSSIARLLTLALPDVPVALLAAIKDRAWPDDTRAILALLQHTPCVVTAANLDALYRIHARTLAPDFLAECFATAPSDLQEACWRSALAAQPAVTVVTMARTPGRVWPGLTATDLAPLLASSAADARLAAIQLMSTLPELSHTFAVTPPAVAAPTSDESRRCVSEEITAPAPATPRASAPPRRPHRT